MPDMKVGRIEFHDPHGRPKPSMISVANELLVAERAGCEKRAAAERAELLADIGTHIHHAAAQARPLRILDRAAGHRLPLRTLQRLILEPPSAPLY